MESKHQLCQIQSYSIYLKKRKCPSVRVYNKVIPVSTEVMINNLYAYGLQNKLDYSYQFEM